MLVVISFLLVILIVVSVHEYGHYLAARCFGVRVLRFSVGFGRPLLRRRDRRGTEWVIAPIPLGGYVNLLDADTAARCGYPAMETMEAKRHWQRIVIYAAGPLANILLALLIAVALLAGGERGLAPLVDHVRPGSPAAAAGVAAGSELAAINGADIRIWRHAERALADAIIGGEDIRLATRAGAQHRIATAALSLADIEQQRGSAAAALGLHPYERHVKLELATVLPDSAAAAAGLQAGDTLVAMDGKVLERWREAVDIISRHPGQPLQLVVWRESQALTVTVTPGQRTHLRQVSGYLGVAPVIARDELLPLVATVSHAPPALAAAALRQTADDVARIASFIRLLLSGELSRRQLHGPIGIAVQSGEAAALGLPVWLRFVALISVNLGAINLLPLPLLDGGQIVLSVVQWLNRRQISERFLQGWNILGVALILTLTAFVILNDIIQSL